MKYTEKIHAKRLLGMLNKKNPCHCCPGLKYYRSNNMDNFYNLYNFSWCKPIIGGLDKVDVMENLICPICKNFLGIDNDDDSCPCFIFGESEAIKRTWLALEEKGYI